MVSIFKSFGLFLRGTLARAYIAIPALLLDPFDIYDCFIKSSLPKEWQMDLVMPSDWGMALFIGLLIWAGVLTFHKEREKVIRLEDRVTPKLLIIFEHHEPYEHEEYTDPSGLVRWRFRIRVKNTWHETLNNCSVKLEAISPNDGTFISRKLKLANDNPPNALNMGHKQTFVLYPGDNELIDVFKFDQTKPNSKIEFCYATEGTRDIHINNTLDSGKWILTIKAMAEVGAPYGQSFIIEAFENETKFSPLQEAT